MRDHLGQALGVHQIDLVQRHQAFAYAEQIEDLHMLAGLRHDAVVGGDHQHHEVDARRTCQHGVHEAFVARHINEAEHLT